MTRVEVNAGITSDAAALAKPGLYYGARVIGDGTNAGLVVIYDNASAASGTVIDSLRCAATDCNGDQFEHPVAVANGIYCDVTTVGRVVIWYE